MDRRDFLKRAALEGLGVARLAAGVGVGAGAGVGAVGFGAGACGPAQAPTSPRGGRRNGDGAPRSRRSAPLRPFPVVRASGSSRELGLAMGRAARGRIETLLRRRARWFRELEEFALADRARRLDGFVAAIAKHHPAALEELKGLAQGAGRSLTDILVLNLQPELAALRHRCGCDGCSTLHLVDGERVYLAHNEDGHDANRDLMLLVRAQPTGEPAFLSLLYPGLIPGNVPALTEAGLALSTNYIGAATVRTGVPRYVVGRALLRARTLDEAIRLARDPHGAYSFHVNLGSRPDRRLLSLELGPGGVLATRETRGGIYVHTNHYLLPKTRGRIPEIGLRPGGSSDSRYRVLRRLVARLPPRGQVGQRDLVRLLASHEAIRAPYAPCRHPRGEIRGRTLATALFDVGAGRLTLYEGNPCEGRARELRLSG